MMSSHPSPLSPEDRDTAARPTVDLLVDGRPLALVPFVETLLANTVRAMVASLHGGEQAQTISLVVTTPKTP